MTAAARDLPAPERAVRVSWRADLAGDARRLAVLTLVGAPLGMLVVGVLGRLAMSLLALLNPDAAGLTSNDGLTIGQFTLAGSLQLIGAGAQFGLIGVFLYAALRGLIVGPPWFRLLSISLGPAVVVVAMVVEPEGVDFTVIRPLWLTIALFTALPAIFVAVLHLGAERFLPRRKDLSRPVVVLGLLLWLPLFPLALALLAGWAALRAVRRTAPGRRVLEHPATGWTSRGALTVVFVGAVVNLVGDVAALA